MRVLARFLTDGAATLAPDADNAVNDDNDDVKWLLGDGSSSVDVTSRVRTDVRVADAQVVGVRKAETTEEDHGLVLTGLSPGVTRVSSDGVVARSREGYWRPRGGYGGRAEGRTRDDEKNSFPLLPMYLCSRNDKWKQPWQ